MDPAFSGTILPSTIFAMLLSATVHLKEAAYSDSSVEPSGM